MFKPKRKASYYQIINLCYPMLIKLKGSSIKSEYNENTSYFIRKEKENECN